MRSSRNCRRSRRLARRCCANCIDDQKARLEQLFELALQARKDLHPAIAEHFTATPVEIVTSEAVRDPVTGRLTRARRRGSTAPSRDSISFI